MKLTSPVFTHQADIPACYTTIFKSNVCFINDQQLQSNSIKNKKRKRIMKKAVLK